MEGNEKKVVAGGEPPEIEAWIGFSEAAAAPDEAELNSPVNLRPNSFKEYIGQERVKENLLIACNAASGRSEPLDHVLLHGPPGLGKTSLARVIASQLGVGLKSTSGPVLERPGDLAAVLTALKANDVLFIDEIHRLPRSVEEVLYPAMEDFKIDIIIGQGPAARSIKLELKPFTLIGATTRTGLLTSPLRDRFGLIHRLEFYTNEQLTEIILRSADLLEVEIDSSSAGEIASKSRGTPRIANRLLKRVRDFAQERASGKISPKVVLEALKMLNIDALGLDQMDRSFLRTIIERFNGGPVGIEALAATLAEDRETLEEVYEPYLLQVGLIVRGRRGREVTDAAYKHLNLPRSGGTIPLFGN